VLEDLQNELDFFDTALQKAMATALNSRLVTASGDTLETRAEELKDSVIKQVLQVRGSSVRVKDWGMTRDRFSGNRGTPAFDYFGRRVPMFHPADKKKISTLYQEFNQLLETLDRVAQTVDQGSRLVNQTVNLICRSLDEGRSALQSKLSEINTRMANAPRIYKESDLKVQISKTEWEEILERFRILKEEILAACDFEASTAAICDFLNLELWRERWRIYELWMLIHVLNLLEGLGFKIDLSKRVVNGLWNLKFSKDKRPVALLVSEDTTLEVYYQLYTRGAESGDMPDIAVKSNGDFLIILDPQHGKTFSLSELTEVAQRYVNLAGSQRCTSLSSLTIIHNFYPMSYSHAIVSEEPRGLVMSDVRPGSVATSKLDHEIVSIIPEEWVTKKSIMIMIDISASTAPVRHKLLQRANDVYRDYWGHADPSSVILLFDTTIVKEMRFSEVENLVDAVSKYSGGGTNLAFVLDTAVERLAAMREPRSLIVFTDGQDSFDSAGVSLKLRSAGVGLQVTESGGLEKDSLLQRLVQELGGKFERI
jgi:hypothetical protein